MHIFLRFFKVTHLIICPVLVYVLSGGSALSNQIVFAYIVEWHLGYIFQKHCSEFAKLKILQ